MTLEIEGNHLFTTAALRYANILRRRARGQHSELNAKCSEFPDPCQYIVDRTSLLGSILPYGSNVGDQSASRPAKALHAQAGAKIRFYKAVDSRAETMNRRTDRSQSLVLGELSEIGVFVSWSSYASPVGNLDTEILVVRMNEAATECTLAYRLARTQRKH